MTFNIQQFIDHDDATETRVARRKTCKKTRVKRFDICIQNPPYDKTLHLKFLREVLKISDKVINISPVRWLLDPFAKDKRSTLRTYEDVAKQITDLEILDGKNASEFDIKIYSNLGIYTFDNNNTNKLDYLNIWRAQKDPYAVSIIEKVCFVGKTKYLQEFKRFDVDGIFVPLSDIAGGRGNLPVLKETYKVVVDGKIDGKDWIDVWNKDPKHGAFKKKKGAKILNIKFDTKEEAINFYNSYKNLKFFKVLCDITLQQQHIQYDRLPFLNNYEHKITNEECYKLFELSKEEIEFIENY